MTEIKSLPVIDFTDLLDVPIDYVGQSGKALIVNGTEDGLIFSSVSGGFITNIANTATINLINTLGTLTANFASLNISQFTNDSGYLTSIVGYVPNARTLTINGTSFDLSANRSWNVGTVTSIATSGLISGGTITGSGTITTSMSTNKLVGRGTAGTGIMEEITLGTNLSLSGNTLNAAGSGITPSALTKTDDTNVTISLGGTPTTALLQAVSLTLGWTGQLSLARGGTNANLTASNGGIFYSTGSAGAILSGTSTANQLLISGASTSPSWYVPTSGRIPYFTTGGAITSDSSLLYDGTNGQFGNTSASTFSIGAPNPTTSTVNQFFIGGNGICLAQNVANGEFEFGLSYYFNGNFKYRFGTPSKPMRLVMNSDGNMDMTFETVASTGTADTNCTFVEQGRWKNNGDLHIKTGSFYTDAGTIVVGATSAIGGERLSVQKDQNSSTSIIVRNQTSGTAAESTFRFFTSTCVGLLGATSALFTPYGVQSASEVYMYSSTGMSLLADGSTGTIKFSCGGSGTERMRLNKTGDLIIEGGFLYMKNTVSNVNYWKGALVSGVLTWTDTGSTAIP